MRRLFAFALLAGALFATHGCDLTDPFPDTDAGDDGGGNGGEGGGGGDPVDMGPDDEPECVDDDDCRGALPVCGTPPGTGLARCVECDDSSFCPADRPVCGSQLACVPAEEGSCREDFDCPVSTPQCLPLSNGAVGVCVECFDDRDCPGAAPVCATTGLCVDNDAFPGCSEDSQCGPGRLCNASGQCVER